MDATEPTDQAEQTDQAQPPDQAEPTGERDLPDLDAVSDAIEQAHEAEETLLAVDPNAINPQHVEHPEEATTEPKDGAPDDGTPAADTTKEPTEPDTSVTEEPSGPRAPSDEPG